MIGVLVCKVMLNDVIEILHCFGLQNYIQSIQQEISPSLRLLAPVAATNCYMSNHQLNDEPSDTTCARPSVGLTEIDGITSLDL